MKTLHAEKTGGIGEKKEPQERVEVFRKTPCRCGSVLRKQV